MHVSSDLKFSNTANLKHQAVKKDYSHQLTAHNKLPSGSFSITTAGEELRLRPSSPHRYTLTSSPRYLSSAFSLTHSRCSTVPSSAIKFIPATELISLEDVHTSYNNSDESQSNVDFEDEPKHLIVYPSLRSNRSSFISSTIENLAFSTVSSPQDQQFSGLSSLAIKTKPMNPIHTRTRTNENGCFDKKSEVASSGKIYCARCKENVRISIRSRRQINNL